MESIEADKSVKQTRTISETKTYLVPISVSPLEQRADDGTCQRTHVECLTWSLLEADTGRVVVRPRSMVLEVAASEDSEVLDLAEAVKQIESDTNGKRCTLLALGPLHLRQWLHPAALQAKVKLGELFDEYLDLGKEFNEFYLKQRGRLSDSGSRSLAGVASLSASSSASSSFSSSGHSLSFESGGGESSQGPKRRAGAAVVEATHQEQQQQEPASDQLYCYCCDCYYYQHELNFYSSKSTPSCDLAQLSVPNSAELQVECDPGAAPGELYSRGRRLLSQDQSRQLEDDEDQQRREQEQQLRLRPHSAVGAPQQPSSGASELSGGACGQIEEMLKFLSIESQGSLEGGRTRCDKCRERASGSFPYDCEPGVANGRQVEPAAADETSDRCHANEHASTRSSSRSSSLSAPALSASFQKQQQQQLPTASDQQQLLEDGERPQDAKKARKEKEANLLPAANARGHCSQCSSRLGTWLVESMSRLVERLLKEGYQLNRPERIKRHVEIGLCDHELAQDGEQRVVRARGLPWQATEQDIGDFFVGLNIGKGGVALCLSRQGRRNGEALIRFESREHRNLALSRHKHFMGSRYIEVYRASSEDFLSVAVGYNHKAQAFLSKGAQVIIRMRGLPFTCTAQDVVEFFSEPKRSGSEPRCQILEGENGVLFVKNHDDKPTGDAFVLFANEEFAQCALVKHRQNIGSRYVELFRSTISEVQQVLSISMDPASASTQAAAVYSGAPISAHQQQAAAASSSGAAKAAANQQHLHNNNNNNNSASHQRQQSHRHPLRPTAAPDSGATVAAAAAAATAWPRPPLAGVTYAQVATSSYHQVAPPAASCGSAQPAANGGQKNECGASDASGSRAPHQAKSSDDQIKATHSATALLAAPSANKGATSGKAASESSAFDANSLNSSSAASENSDPGGGVASGGGRGQVSAPVGSQEQLANCEQLLSASSSAQSPVSTISAGSTASSSYKSSQYGGGSHAYHQRAASNYFAGGRAHHQFHHHYYHHQSGQPHSQAPHHYLASQEAQQHRQQHGYLSPMHPMAAGGAYPRACAQAAGATAPSPYQQQQQQMAAHHLAANPYSPLQFYAAPPPHTHPGPALHPHALAHLQYGMPAPGPLEQVAGSPGAASSRRDCIRLRGLPFEAQVEDVLYFLGEHSKGIVYQGVHMVYSAQGQATGEAIIQMSSCQAAVMAAHEFHRKMMSVGKKQRYIEVIPCSIDDMNLMLGFGLLGAGPHHHHRAHHPSHHAGPAPIHLAPTSAHLVHPRAAAVAGYPLPPPPPPPGGPVQYRPYEASAGGPPSTGSTYQRHSGQSQTDQVQANSSHRSSGHLVAQQQQVPALIKSATNKSNAEGSRERARREPESGNATLPYLDPTASGGDSSVECSPSSSSSSSPPSSSSSSSNHQLESESSETSPPLATGTSNHRSQEQQVASEASDQPQGAGGNCSSKNAAAAQATGLAAAAAAAAAANLVPATYYPVLYYYPQQMLAAPYH